MTGLFDNLFRRSTPVPVETTSIKDASIKDTSAYEEISDQQVPRLAFPAEIPENIREAYEQACFLLKRCPKASGALSRYCLQQIARDFWELPDSERGTLSEEFSMLSDRVLAETQVSINYIRKFGTIESQLTKDRDLMVETTVEEAKMLIALVQLLVQEWYVDRQKRQCRSNTIKLMVDEAKSNLETESIKHCLAAPENTKLQDPETAKPPPSTKSIEAALTDALEKMPSTGG